MTTPTPPPPIKKRRTRPVGKVRLVHLYDSTGGIITAANAESFGFKIFLLLEARQIEIDPQHNNQFRLTPKGHTDNPQRPV